MNKNSLRLEFQNGLKGNYIVTYLENKDNIVNYEVEMINNNRAVRALAVEIRQLNEKVKVIYDITGKISIKKYLKGRTLKKSEFISILKNMATCIVECKNYFLDERKYFIKLDAIFIDEKDLNVYLIYLPFNIDDREDVNNAYRNIVKDLIIDFVSVEEKNSENIIQKTLKYLRKDDFNIEDFKDYIEELEEQNLKIIHDVGSTRKEEKQFNKNANNFSENLNNTDKPKTLGEEKVEKKPKEINNYMFIVFIQLIAFGVIGIMCIFEIIGTIMIISIVAVIVIDIVLTILIVLAKLEENNVKSGMKIANTGLADKELEKNLRSNKISKREIVTEMSFDTELLDTKTAFLMSKKAGTVEKIFINKDNFKIGRLSGEVDYISDNRAVGKIHAEIKIQDDKYYLIDLSSRNGTYINGQRIKSNKLYEIKNEDSVAFANSEFKFSI